MADRLDMRDAVDRLDVLRALLASLDGQEVDDPSGETNNRAKRRQAATTSRELLLAQHLADKVRLAIADQFFIFRRMDPDG